MAKQIKYSGTVVVPVNKLTTFGENRDSIECMEILKSGMAKINDLDLKNITFVTGCVPVRLTLDPKDTSQDWTKYGSPIEEIGFGNIIRYFPMSAFKFDKSNKKEKITISYPDFIIDLQVVYESQPADNIVYTEPKEPKEPKESKEDMEMVETTTETVVGTAGSTEVTTAENQKKKLPKWTIGAVVGAVVVTTAAIITAAVVKNKNKDKGDCECTEFTESESTETVESVE